MPLTDEEALKNFPVRGLSPIRRPHALYYPDLKVNSGGGGLALWYSALVSINEVNLRRARLALRWVTLFGFNSRCRTFISVCNQPPIANSAFHPSGVGKWVPASTGKVKAGIVHSVSGWTRGVQVKLWDTLRTHAIPERLRGVITTRRYTNPRLPLPYLRPVPGRALSRGKSWIRANHQMFPRVRRSL